MTREQTLRAAALNLLRELAALDEKHARYVAALRELQPDIFIIAALPVGVEERVVSLIDAVFSTADIAAYLRWEAPNMRDGGLIEVGGRVYPIRTVDDEYPLGAPK